MANNEVTSGTADPSSVYNNGNYPPQQPTHYANNGPNRQWYPRGRRNFNRGFTQPRAAGSSNRGFNNSSYTKTRLEQTDHSSYSDRNVSSNSEKRYYRETPCYGSGRVGAVPKKRDPDVGRGASSSRSGPRTNQRNHNVNHGDERYSRNDNYDGYRGGRNNQYRGRANYNARGARNYEQKQTNVVVVGEDKESVPSTSTDGNLSRFVDGKTSPDEQSENTEAKKANWNHEAASNSRKPVRHNNSSGTKSKSLAKNYQRTQRGDGNKKQEKDISQRDRLIEQLAKNAYECMVCCDRVRVQDPIWNCQNCFHVFHLKCIKKWAKSPSSIVEGFGWRCPACQHITEKTPYYYYCFCGKSRDPAWNHYDTPHSCGEVCGKQRSNKNCVHHCNILCHPGPCPSCHVQIQRACECGKVAKPVPCGHTAAILCNNVCEKKLNCGVHICQKPCHEHDCDLCAEKIQQKCFCSKKEREVPCTGDNVGKLHFSCGSACDLMLNCGNHRCEAVCHEGGCVCCPLSPDVVTSCPCGQTLLSDISSEKRTTCLDPVPTCGKTCNKVLPCGSEDSVHKCLFPCHEGPCPYCLLKTSVKCQCGFQSQDVDCKDLPALGNIVCKKRCNKKRQCGRHKCLKNCCTDENHACEMICNRKLSCGLHACEEPCHRGNCPPCWHTSFDELTCHCGKTIMFPPIACGTKPPECNELCTRPHDCDHPVMHTCHSDAKCPPCTFLTEKWCYGNHELRSNVPCYLRDISCGLPCGKPLPCGSHKCLLICHPGNCTTPENHCKQLCTVPRSICEHPCAAPCHPDKSCPSTACRAKVLVKCPCGNLVEEISCAENLQALRQEAASAVASKLSELQAGNSIAMGEIFKSKPSQKKLECNADCELIDRNRRLALALQIRNPELTNKLGPPAYTDFLREHMRQNSQLVTSTYNKLAELVQMAKQSKQKSRSYAFPPMNRDHRRVIHELAEFFGCETCSYDEEPKKNVVATALRDKSWLPSVSIMTVMERELVPRKAPPPIPHHKSQTAPRSTTENAQTDVGKPAEEPVPQKNKIIDYFDYNPE